MQFLLDVLLALFFGTKPTSTVGFCGIALIPVSYAVSGSWLLLWIAVLSRFGDLSLRTFIRHVIRRKSTPRKEILLAQVHRDQIDQEIIEDRGGVGKSRSGNEDWEKIEKYAVGSAGNGEKGPADTQYEGIIGFLHPFCNAGGGGERVLWAAVKATQERYPKAICVVYTGDHHFNKTAILNRVSKRFDIQLHAPTILFLYLNTRDYVVADYWPRFTLFGQAVGSMVMAWDALSLLTPDILVDTMGYAFSTAFCKYIFPEIPSGAYVHYPFIGTHMLESLTSDAGHGINAGAGKGARGTFKKFYWWLLVNLYIFAGRSVDVVMTNSSWTRAHMVHLWGSYRQKKQIPPIEVLFPPVAVEEIIDAIPLEGPSVAPREKKLVYIAQFRPEKNHELILQSFSQIVKSKSPETAGVQLVLIGSARDSEDETLVYKLRLLARELSIEGLVDFRTKDVAWPEIVECLRTSSVGVNGMWCEHFGIGVVEYQAAGLIAVVNDSGGPKQDIVVDFDGGPTGFHATTAEQYAAHFTTALALSPAAATAMRHRARASSKRFTTSHFALGWIQSIQKLIDLQTSRSTGSVTFGPTSR